MRLLCSLLPIYIPLFVPVRCGAARLLQAFNKQRDVLGMWRECACIDCVRVEA